MNVVFVGLSITSSWGNGHATNYRALTAELHRRGHDVLFCERDVPWYAAHRDLSQLPGGRLLLYESIEQLRRLAGQAVADADLVILGSYVPEGAAVAEWLLGAAGGAVAFYDIDTPITVQKLEHGDREYLGAEQVREFDLYLSFTGGPLLEVLSERFGARRPLAFHCLVDPTVYVPQPGVPRLDLGYLGTYSADRQPTVERLLVAVAERRPGRRFAVAGSSYPEDLRWPANVTRIEHLAPHDHAAFYGDQRFTLNVTREQMRRSGYSPSVRLFEAAACGVPIISDDWPGLEEVFVADEEILIARSGDDVVAILEEVDEPRRREIGWRARRRVLREHTAAVRIDLLERELAGEVAA